MKLVNFVGYIFWNSVALVWIYKKCQLKTFLIVVKHYWPVPDDLRVAVPSPTEGETEAWGGGGVRLHVGYSPLRSRPKSYPRFLSKIFIQVFRESLGPISLDFQMFPTWRTQLCEFKVCSKHQVNGIFPERDVTLLSKGLKRVRRKQRQTEGRMRGWTTEPASRRTSRESWTFG